MSSVLDQIRGKVTLSEEFAKITKIYKKGSSHWCCCLFHDEKTPSCLINNEKGIYHCFGCGAHGDIFTLMVKHFKLEFKDVVRELAQRFNLKITNFNFKGREKLLMTMEEACKIYESNLTEEALDYLIKRGLKEESIKKFRLGFSKGNTVVDNLMSKGHVFEEINKCGIALDDGRDRFKGRIIFPILDRSKKVIGFSGRAINDEQPKYLNSPETEIFQKSMHLFAENFLEPSLPVVLVEGYMDVIAMYQLGFKNIVGSMGTAVSAGQILSILRISDSLLIMLDGDNAGRKAVFTVLKLVLGLITPEKDVRVCFLPPGKDPDSLSKEGKQVVQDILNRAVPIVEVIYEYIYSFYTGPEKSSMVLKMIDEVVATIKDKHVKEGFRIFFKKKSKDFFTGISRKRRENFSMEDKVIGILAKNPDIYEDILEEIMLYEFKDEKYESIRLRFIDDMTINMIEHSKIRDKIVEELHKINKNLLESNDFSYIISNRSFAIQYTQDILRLLMSKSS